MTLKTDINIPQAIITAGIITLLMIAVLFVVCFEETDDAGNVVGVSKPRFNFFK